MTALAEVGSFVALCGGVGGAKLALGLSHVLPADALTIIVNTGDDFEHVGLHVSPDIDTVLYTLAGLSNAEQGWGLQGETWGFMSALKRLGGPAWFQLGDHDLATHVLRTQMLRSGASLSAITDILHGRLGIGPKIVPMSDQPVRTFVQTDEGRLPFQSYFVERQCQPKVLSVTFDGATGAQPAPAAIAALQQTDLRGIIVCPSNPWLSIDPMLSLPGWRAALRAANAPLIAVTPLVAGQSIKGPTAKIMSELGLELSIRSIVEHYRGLIDGFVLDDQDRDLAGELGLPAITTQTIMRTLEDRIGLARATVDFCRRLERRSDPEPRDETA